MQLFAVALICAASMPAQDCNRTTALDVVVSRAVTPIVCALRGQALFACGPLGAGVGEGAYVTVVCERQKDVAIADR